MAVMVDYINQLPVTQDAEESLQLGFTAPDSLTQTLPF
jgi:hypothetical protein